MFSREPREDSEIQAGQTAPEFQNTTVRKKVCSWQTKPGHSAALSGGGLLHSWTVDDAVSPPDGTVCTAGKDTVLPRDGFTSGSDPVVCVCLCLQSRPAGGGDGSAGAQAGAGAAPGGGAGTTAGVAPIGDPGGGGAAVARGGHPLTYPGEYQLLRTSQPFACRGATLMARG